MEHPPKQGLKHKIVSLLQKISLVLMEHPPKQGLKHLSRAYEHMRKYGFNGTSTKTRIETSFRFSSRKVASWF